MFNVGCVCTAILVIDCTPVTRAALAPASVAGSLLRHASVVIEFCANVIIHATSTPQLFITRAHCQQLSQGRQRVPRTNKNVTINDVVLVEIQAHEFSRGHRSDHPGV